MNQPTRIIRLQAVMHKTGLSKSSVYRLSNGQNSDFPAAVRLSQAAVGWRESEVDAWIQSRRVAA